MKNNKGFTLIELIVVIVILGILSATALPRFFDARTDAQNAAIAGVAGGLASATAVNFGAAQLGHQVIPPTISNAAAATVCGLAAQTLQGGLPAGYSVVVASTNSSNCSPDGFVSCSVSSTQANNPPASVGFAATCY